ncbi:hypothetical protein [Rivularia sp. UHCC 0363]|nr:hypothetical protein [Rivularia sp. UHCC 0363]MEA5596369.1 hypothetical protein [Rivularia sp. UHCC 0363]
MSDKPAGEQLGNLRSDSKIAPHLIVGEIVTFSSNYEENNCVKS